MKNIFSDILGFSICLILSFWNAIESVIISSDKLALAFTHWVGLIGAILMAAKLANDLRLSFFSSTKNKRRTP